MRTARTNSWQKFTQISKLTGFPLKLPHVNDNNAPKYANTNMITTKIKITLIRKQKLKVVPQADSQLGSRL